MIRNKSSESLCERIKSLYITYLVANVEYIFIHIIDITGNLDFLSSTANVFEIMYRENTYDKEI